MQSITPAQPYLIQARAIHQCPNCGQPLKSIFQPPSTTSNWLMATIALLLTPFLIGILLWIAYSRKVKEQAQTNWWHCESCGFRRAAFAPAKNRTREQVILVAVLVGFVAIIVWRNLPHPKDEKPTAAQAAPAATPAVVKTKRHR